MVVSNPTLGLTGWARICRFCGIVIEGTLEECLEIEISASKDGCRYCGGKESLPKLKFPLVAFAPMRIILERVFWVASQRQVKIGFVACGRLFLLSVVKGTRPFRVDDRRYKRLYGVYARMRKEVERLKS